MGYDTYYYGELTVSEPLSAAEVAVVHEYANHPHFWCRPDEGACSCDVAAANLVDFARAQGYSGRSDWCISEDGGSLVWAEAPKSNYAVGDITYLIGMFLSADSPLKAELAARGDRYPTGCRALTFDHVVSGTVEAAGDHPRDRWDLTVVDNVVSGGTPEDIDWDDWG